MDDELVDLKIVRIGRVYSGVSLAMVRQWIEQRRVLPEDLVRPVGAERWMKVSLAPELAPETVLRPPASPLPPVAHRIPTVPVAAVPAATPRSAQSIDTVAAPVGAPQRRSAPGGEQGSAPGSSADLDSTDLGIAAPAKTRPKRRRRILEDTELDMTPMIDVTFQLLIFFMLANQLANPSPIEVPVATHGKGIMPDGKQAILMDDKGRYYLGDDPKEEAIEPSVESLVQKVAENATAAEQPLEVIISAHKNSRHQHVRELLEQLGKVQNLGPIHLGVEELK